jgi:hypothetical protein
MADVIMPLVGNNLSEEYTYFVKALTREESAWVHYWSKIYYDLVIAPEAVPEETVEFVNCILKGALSQYNEATMKAIGILEYFGVQRKIKSFRIPPSRGPKLLPCSL